MGVRGGCWKCVEALYIGPLGLLYKARVSQENVVRGMSFWYPI
jgi:hypothetical protein